MYVALVQRPGGLADDQPEDELASLLHAKIGEDGLYVVAVDTVVGHLGWQTYGADVPGKWDLARVNPPPAGGERTSSAAGEAAELIATALNDAEPLPGAQLAEYRTADPWVQHGSTLSEDIGAPTEGTYAVVATGLGVAVAIVAWFVLRTIARWRELAPATPVVAGVPRGVTPGTAAPTRPAPTVRRRAPPRREGAGRASTARCCAARSPSRPTLADPAASAASTVPAPRPAPCWTRATSATPTCWSPSVPWCWSAPPAAPSTTPRRRTGPASSTPGTARGRPGWPRPSAPATRSTCPRASGVGAPDPSQHSPSQHSPGRS